MSARRVPLLVFGPGALRLLLAVMVFVSHVSSLNVGRPAVLLFFILSGYWVSRLFATRQTSVPYFWFDRWFRIWPLMALVVVTWVLVQPLVGVSDGGSLISTLALLGLNQRRDTVLEVLWTLDLELQFYLLLPFVFALARPGRLQWLGLGAAAAWMLGWWLQPITGNTILCYAPNFAAGMALYATRWSPSKGVALGSVVLFVLIALGLAGFPETRHAVFKSGDAEWVRPFHTLWTLMLVPFVAWNLHQPSSARDRTMGDMSYPFYLVHAPLATLAWLWFAITPANKLLLLLVTLLVTYVAYALIDRPIERFRLALRDRAARRLSPAR
jgi:peptidoglycan/LPS O-acetylase OafA/YrhL